MHLACRDKMTNFMFKQRYTRLIGLEINALGIRKLWLWICSEAYYWTCFSLGHRRNFDEPSRTFPSAMTYNPVNVRIILQHTACVQPMHRLDANCMMKHSQFVFFRSDFGVGSDTHAHNRQKQRHVLKLKTDPTLMLISKPSCQGFKYTQLVIWKKDCNFRKVC